MAEPAHSDEPLLKTPLHAEHVALGARMVPFAGYDMPVQYPTGILTEHNWTREHAGLFDVSHLGQAFLVADSPQPIDRMETLLADTCTDTSCTSESELSRGRNNIL